MAKRKLKSDKPKLHSGYKFRHMEVLGVNKERTTKFSWYYDCECTCGTKVVTSEGVILGNGICSCGCISKRFRVFGEIERGEQLRGVEVLYRLEDKKDSYRVRCVDCGAERDCAKKHLFLKEGLLPCTCRNRKNYSVLKQGYKWNTYTIIERTSGEEGSSEARYLCRCECGSLREFPSRTILHNSPDTCTRCRAHSLSDYEDMGNYVALLCTGGNKALVDKEDLERVVNRKWFCDQRGYVKCNKLATDNVETKQISMHRYIMNPPSNMVVDHINHNPLDNRKCNLRICTEKENYQNRKLPSTNSSGLKGVNVTKYSRWTASISKGDGSGKTDYLGSYSSKIDAAIAYDKEALKLFKEFSATNYSLGLLSKQDLINRGETYYEQVDEFKALHS